MTGVTTGPLDQLIMAKCSSEAQDEHAVASGI